MSCAACGKQFEAKRAGHRFCSVVCRKRGHRAVESRPSRPVSVEAATLRQLEAAGVVESALGQAALVLAARLDVAGESGATLAQLADKLRVTLDAATRQQGKVADPVDELAERRRRRLASG